MPRPSTPTTLFSALLLGLALSSLPLAVVADGPRLMPHRRAGENGRMIRQYVPPARQHEHRALGIFDPLFPDDGGDENPLSTTSSSTTASLSTTNSASLSTASASPTHTLNTITSQPTPTSTTTIPRPPTTQFVYEDLTPEEKHEVDENRQRQQGLSRIPPHVRTSLIIAASVIGGLYIIWTAVRRWKFRSSSNFQRRLAPIEWQADEDDRDAQMREPYSDDRDSVRRNMFAADGASSLAPPSHDFTAGPGGYRSASPSSNFRSGSPAPGFRSASPGPVAAYRTNSPIPNHARTPSPPTAHYGY